MNYNPQIHNRRSERLKNYDYSQEGTYFLLPSVVKIERIYLVK